MKQYPLHWAAETGNTQTIHSLLQTGDLSPDIEDEGGATPLHRAAWKGQVEAVNVLLVEYKADVEVSSIKNSFYLVAILIDNRLFSDYSFNVQHICSSTM